MSRVAVVTGANKGIGFATVKALCKKYNGIVYLTSRDVTRGLEAVKKLIDIDLTPHYHQLDVCDEQSVKTFAEYIKNKHGNFDVLVNNAGILEWGEVYPTYEAAKRNIEVNYKSLLTLEKYLFPLLRDDARIVNVSSACGHLSNLKNKAWISMLLSPDLTVQQLNNFVDNYLESVKNGTFDKNDFADDGKHAEHRVSKIAVTAPTMIWQRKYENFSINAVHPGHVKTDMANGGGSIEPDESAEVIVYLVLEASSKLKGTFMWHNKKLIDWYDPDTDFACKDVW